MSSDLDDALGFVLGGTPQDGGAGGVPGTGGVPDTGGVTGAGGALDLVGLQRVLGGYQWVERRAFEVIGAWVATEVVPEARIVFDVHSQQHAWHAELFAERMPSVEGVDPASYVLPPSAEADRLFAGLGGGAGVQEDASRPASGGTLLRLVGLARVLLPRLVAGYGRHLGRCASVADAPVVRALRLVLRDDVEAWQAAEAMVQSLVRRPHDVAVVTAHQQVLEEQVAGAGPGLVPWPGDIG
jgi:hypothetical protein